MRATVVEVSSDSSTAVYRVWVGPDGPIFCDCPGHKYARGGVRKPCKHMLRLGADPVGAAASQIAAGHRPLAPSGDPRFRFIEVQDSESGGAWAAVATERFTQLLD